MPSQDLSARLDAVSAKAETLVLPLGTRLALEAAAEIVAEKVAKKFTKSAQKTLKKSEKKNAHKDKIWVKVTTQPTKHKNSFLGRATFIWKTDPDEKKHSVNIPLHGPGKLSIKGKDLHVQPQDGEAYNYGSKEDPGGQDTKTKSDAPHISGASDAVNDALGDLHVAAQKAETPSGLPTSFEAPVLDTPDKLKSFKDMADDATTEWWVRLSEDEGSSLRYYTGEGYERMNKILRGEPLKNKHKGEDAKEAIPLVSKALSKASMPESVTAFRGTSDPGLVARFESGDLIGGSVITNQFFSTTVDKKTADEFLEMSTDDTSKPGRVVWDIKVPKGAKAAYVDSVSSNANEHEVLLNHGSELRIKNAIMKDGVLHVEAEYASK